MSSAVVKSDKADVSRSRILDEAARLFREQGYASVSLRAIAAAAGMKAGSVYYHFDSKQAIVIEILDAGIAAVDDAVRRTMRQLPEGRTAAQTIRAGVFAHLQTLFEFSDYTSANVRIYAQVPPQVRKANLAARRNYEALWGEILEPLAGRGAIRAEVDLRIFRLMLIGSLNATLEWFNPQRGDLDQLADRYSDFLLHGVLASSSAEN